jgi:hypothetical protein
MVLITPKPAISTGIIIITMGFWVGFSPGWGSPKKKPLKSLHACFVKRKTEWDFVRQE